MIKPSNSKDGCYQDYIETCFKKEDVKKFDDFDMICKIFDIDIKNEIDFYDHELYQKILDNKDKDLGFKYDIIFKNNWDYDWIRYFYCLDI